MKFRALAILLLLGACVAASGPPAPIPPPMAESVPNPPVSPVPLTWQPGHWNWTGSSFVWVPGQYVDLGGRPGNWMPPFWQQTNGGWVWQQGHWM
ncbi:MAG TPA: hypothetical protein VFL55_18260 [Acetobacteraceae bacterium]|nr:hypothetical protein [Acetobacteraceae bacterium]